jgi:thiol-disulfide isomerase/thioredoxin
MKKVAYLIITCLLFLNCKAQEPLTEFPEDALNDTFVTLNGENIIFKEILEKYKGQTIFVDVWASWCGDCLKGMPKVKALQEENRDLVYLFLSADRSFESWKKGIRKHQVIGEHYFMPKGMKSVFGKAIDLDWIPRYMIIDSEGNIKLFRAIKADDSQLIKTLN